MSHRSVLPRPASPALIRRRILAVLAFLPVGLDDLAASVVLHSADAAPFEAELAALLDAGAVVPDADSEWLRLAAM